MRTDVIKGVLWLVILGSACVSVLASAEPYLAVRTGLTCSQCHVNPTGGGKRKPFGNLWSQNELAASNMAAAAAAMGLAVPEKAWDGQIFAPYLAIGGNVRGKLNYVDRTQGDNQSAFMAEEELLYLQLSLIPQRLLFYLDQRMGPGGALNREFYGLFYASQQRFYIKAGRFFLPYGFRLEDDFAFVRQATGINFASSDDGVEFGWDTRSFTAQLALSNGENGAGETDRGKQLSSRVAFIQPGWRFGASANWNNRDRGDRNMGGVFAGLRTGPVVWLAEWDRIEDQSVAGDLEQELAFLEANILLRKGHNLKLSAEAINPDTRQADDRRQRYSAIWEYFPIPFVQVNTGVRRLQDERSGSLLENDELFVQLHLFF